MKRQTLLLALTFLIGATTLYAQPLGVRLGVNIAKITWEEVNGDFDYESDSEIGIDIAVFSQLVMSESVIFQPELHFIQKGGSEEDLDEDVNLSYLELHLPFMYHFSTEGNVSPFAALGPHLGFLVGGEAQFGGDPLDANDYFKSIDAGISIGAGVELLAGTTPLQIDLRYHLGLANVSDDDDWEAQNRAFTIGVGAVLSGQ